MSDQTVGWWVQLALKPGQHDNFKSLTGEMVATTRQEPGVLSYQRFISEDGNVIYLYERYTDSRAAREHLETFGKIFAERFLGMVQRTRFVVFGEPDHNLKILLDGIGTTYVKPFGTFRYWADAKDFGD